MVYTWYYDKDSLILDKMPVPVPLLPRRPWLMHRSFFYNGRANLPAWLCGHGKRPISLSHAGRFGGRFGPCRNALAHRPLRNAARGMIFYYIVWPRPAVAPFRGMAAATTRKRQSGCASLPLCPCRLSPMLRHACRRRCRPLALPLQPSPLARPPAALSGRCRHPFVAMAGGLWQ